MVMTTLNKLKEEYSVRQYFIDGKPVTKEVFKWYDEHQNLEDDSETYYETAGLNYEIAEIVEDSNTVSQTLKLYGHTYMSEKGA
jgi:hypothetical protein